MSSALPSGWGINTEDGNGASLSGSTGGASAAGVWDLDVVINPQTSIACVELPYFSKERPLQGTKAARDSLIKLLTGMNNDVSPVNFRDKTEKDHVTPDPYYPAAPGWSTLSGGRKPYVHMAPAEFVGKLKRAARCVPLVRATRVFVIDAHGNKTAVTDDELAAMNIQAQPVPNMYQQAAAASTGSTSSGASSSSAIDVSHIVEKQDALEKQLATMKALLEQMAATAAATMAATRATAPAAGASASGAAPAEPVDVADDDEPVVLSSRARGKRPRAA